MKVLVLWLDPDPESRTTSVVDKKDIKYDKESVKAKWERKWYDVKIIAEDENKKWLESLTIDTEGNIINSKDKESRNSLLAGSRQLRKNIRKQEEAANKANNNAAGNTSIFNIGDDDSPEKGNENGQEEAAEPEIDDIIDIDLTTNHEYSDEKNARTTGNKKSDKSVTKNELKKKKNGNKSSEAKLESCYFCTTYTEDATYEDKCRAILESTLLHLQRLREEYDINPASSNEITLAAGYDVKMNRYKLNDFKRLCKNDAKSLTRSILKELLGEEKLSKITASAIPEDILNAVERYVNTNVCKNAILNLSAYKRCITNYCFSLKTKFGNKENESAASIKPIATPANAFSKVMIRKSVHANDNNRSRRRSTSSTRSNLSNRTKSPSLERSRRSASRASSESVSRETYNAMHTMEKQDDKYTKETKSTESHKDVNISSKNRSRSREKKSITETRRESESVNGTKIDSNESVHESKNTEFDKYSDINSKNRKDISQSVTERKSTLADNDLGFGSNNQSCSREPTSANLSITNSNESVKEIKSTISDKHSESSSKHRKKEKKRDRSKEEHKRKHKKKRRHRSKEKSRKMKKSRSTSTDSSRSRDSEPKKKRYD